MGLIGDELPGFDEPLEAGGIRYAIARLNDPVTKDIMARASCSPALDVTLTKKSQLSLKPPVYAAFS